MTNNKDDVKVTRFEATDPCICGSKRPYGRCCGTNFKNPGTTGGFTAVVRMEGASTGPRTHFAVAKSIFDPSIAIDDIFYKNEEGLVLIFTEEMQAWQLQQRLIASAGNTLAFGVARMSDDKFSNFAKDFEGKYILVPPSQTSA